MRAPHSHISMRYVYQICLSATRGNLDVMAHVILGLLLLGNMSLYDLIKAMEQGTSLFYSASAGSIKRALDGLLKRGDIHVVSQETTGRKRKIYGITPQGRITFHAWMMSPPENADLDAAALTRIYFLGLLDEPERVTVLESIRDAVSRSATTLEHTQDQVKGQSVPAELASIAHYTKATLEYGIRTHDTALTWLEELIAQAKADVK